MHIIHSSHFLTYNAEVLESIGLSLLADILDKIKNRKLSNIYLTLTCRNIYKNKCFKHN